MNELHLFAGAGGGILGSELLGHTTVCAVEIEPYPRKVLLQRQRDGVLPKFPIWDDIRTFDGTPWNGLVDIVAGGFPCQDISAAGKGTGIEGERSGLWGEMARVVREVEPRFVYVENSPMLTSRGLHRVLGDLADMGYDARWCVLGADDAGAPHRRKRVWILGYTTCERTGAIPTGSRAKGKGTSHLDRAGEDLADTKNKGLERQYGSASFTNEESWSSDTWPTNSNQFYWWDIDPADLPNTNSGSKPRMPFNAEMGCKQKSEQRKPWPTESRLGRVAHGVANRVDRLKAIGNGQVPAVAAIAFTILSEGLI